MAKTLCDWSKNDIAKRAEVLAAIISEPRFFCGKCARAAVGKRYLCKPQPLPQPTSTAAQGERGR